MMFEPKVSVILSISNDVKDVMMNKIIRHSVIQTPSCIYSFAAIKQEENFRETGIIGNHNSCSRVGPLPWHDTQDPPTLS